MYKHLQITFVLEIGKFCCNVSLSELACHDNSSYSTEVSQVGSAVNTESVYRAHLGALKQNSYDTPVIRLYILYFARARYTT